MKRVTELGEIKLHFSEQGSTCYLCGAMNLHHSGAVLENVRLAFPEQVVAVCKECSARRRKRPISMYVTQRFTDLSVELAVITELRRGLSQFAPVSASTNTMAAKLAELADNWEDDDVPTPATRNAAIELASARMTDEEVNALPQNDKRLDETTELFDVELYNRWIHL